jgi:ELWxxDGT repeat protein
MLAFSSAGCNFFGNSGGSSVSDSDGSGDGDGGGNGDGDDGGATADSAGFFVDRGVAGLTYRAEPSKITGTTDADGRYEYLTGDTIYFSIGDIELGSSAGSEYVTPMSLFPDDKDMALNLAQFLQSIDDNNNPNDGITPSVTAVEALSGIDFTSDTSTFETFLQSKLPAGLTFVSREVAMNHMETTFNTYAINPNGQNHSVKKIFPGYDSEHGVELWTTSDGKNLNFVKELDNGGTLGSYPDNITQAGSRIFYTAETEGYGQELWVTDGTAAGTKLVKDITPGADNTEFDLTIALGDKLIFTAYTDDYGKEMWVSDGTEAGTFMLKDIKDGSYTSSPEELTLFNNKVYFTATSDNEGREVWYTDGTTAGTNILVDYNTNGDSAPQMLTVAAGSLWYRAYSTTSTYDIVKSDGTTGGTAAYETNIGTSYGMAEFNGKLYYFGNGYLNYTDGSSTTQLLMVSGGSDLTAGDTILYLLANGTGASSTLHKTDGVTQGFLIEIFDANSGSAQYPYDLVTVGDRLFFLMHTNEYGGELYTSDGSTFTFLKDIYPGSENSYIEDMTELDGKLYFDANSPDEGRQLWVSDGTTAGTVVLKDFTDEIGNEAVDGITAIEGNLYFSAQDSDGDSEMWTSDGTEEGTVLYVETNTLPASGMQEYVFSVKIGDRFAFGRGEEIWVTDGTAAGTAKTEYTSSTMGVYANMGDYAVILLTDEGGYRILKTDGTVSGTSIIEEFYSIEDYFITRAGDNFLFYGRKTIGETNAMYTADGTANSAVRLLDSDSSEITRIESCQSVGDKAAIKTVEDTGTGYAYKLYFTDGTTAGTVTAIDVTTTGYNTRYLSNMISVGDLVYYINDMDTDGYELWSSDGTVGGEVFVKTISEDMDHFEIQSMIDVDGTLYFVYMDSETTHYLWKSDGTAATTVQVKDFYAGRIADPEITITPLAVVDDKLYFLLRDDIDNLDDAVYSVWVVDNTTGLVREVEFGDADFSTYTLIMGNRRGGGVSRDTEYILAWLVNREDSKGQLVKVLGSSITVLQESDYFPYRITR